MSRTLCTLIIRFSTYRLVWKSLKVLQADHHNNSNNAPEVDFEILQLWCLIAFHSMLVFTGVDTICGAVIPLYYYLKLILCIATFTPGTKVPNFLFHLGVVPAIECVHTLLTSDLPSMMHILQHELQLLPFKLVDWFLLPGAFCLDLQHQPQEADNPRLPPAAPLNVDDFSTPPPAVVASPTTTRTPLAPVKKKRLLLQDYNNNINHVRQDSSFSRVRCSLHYHMDASSSNISPLASISRPLFQDSPVLLVGKHETIDETQRNTNDDFIIPRLLTDYEERVVPTDTTTAMEEEEQDDDDANSSIQSCDSTMASAGVSSSIYDTPTPPPTTNRNVNITSCIPKDNDDAAEVELCVHSPRIRTGRPSLTGHVRAILTGSSDTSIREFYLDIRQPSPRPSNNNKAIPSNAENDSDDAYRGHPILDASTQQSIIESPIVTTAAAQLEPHVSTRRSARIRARKLTYYR